MSNPDTPKRQPRRWLQHGRRRLITYVSPQIAHSLARHARRQQITLSAAVHQILIDHFALYSND
jgi:hypothetical protein